MGCDIHLFTENEIKGKWFNCDNWKINPYYEEDEDDGNWKWIVNSLFRGRNYYLFSILANVRNYSENDYICNPRGLPPDVSEATKLESDYYGSDGHSHSYFTLAELKDFHKNHCIIKYSGYVTPEDALKIDLGKMPDFWCEYTNISSYVYREWERAGSPLDNLIKLLEERMREEFYLHEDDDTAAFEKRIRIVFWFDN